MPYVEKLNCLNGDYDIRDNRLPTEEQLVGKQGQALVVQSDGTIAPQIIGTAQDVQNNLDQHIDDTNNPHGVTASQINAVQYVTQSLTTGQKTIARNNIEANPLIQFSSSGILKYNSSQHEVELADDFTDYFYIENNAAAHNSVFRGKNLTGDYDLSTVLNLIGSRLNSDAEHPDFSDLYIGDYFVYNTEYIMRIAGFNLFYPQVQVNHVVLVPDQNMAVMPLNSTVTYNQYTGGYANSELYQYIDSMFNDISDYTLDVNNLYLGSSFASEEYPPATLPNKNKLYYDNTKSVQNYSTKVNLMTENQVFGTDMLSSSYLDDCNTHNQFPLFSLAPQYIIPNQSYWLSNYCGMMTVGSDSVRCFSAVVKDTSNNQIKVRVTGMQCNTNLGVRPYILIGGYQSE